PLRLPPMEIPGSVGRDSGESGIMQDLARARLASLQPENSAVASGPSGDSRHLPAVTPQSRGAAAQQQAMEEGVESPRALNPGR
ncbi:MAG: hypothetical protein ABR518_09200, partial [Actinomycetota bacterium]